jgi:uncharacterized membrane protein
MESRLNPQEAQAALDAVGRSHADIADRLYTPWRYHLILGLLVGGLIAFTGFTSDPFSIAVVAFGIGLFLLVLAYRRKAGVWADGTAGPRAWRQATIAAIVGGALAVSGCALVILIGTSGPSVAVGAILAVLTVVGGRGYDKRAGLRGSA